MLGKVYALPAEYIVSMFRQFLDAYIKACNEVITTSCNCAVLFDAGEHAARDLQVKSLDEVVEFFKEAGFELTYEKREDGGVSFRLYGFPENCGCSYAELLRGFFGEIARKLVDPRCYTSDCRTEKDGCVFTVDTSPIS